MEVFVEIDRESRYYVAIIGAGPAGLFAARQLADRNIQVVLLNRDIKPGGLAEYGIYPTKIKMKEGLRNQFRQILNLAEVEYYGNVLVGQQADLSLDEVRAFGFNALLVTVGAQSTKRLGLPGEELTGVYHAKDVVYHYNLLPPFSESAYQIGKRVAVIGAGNVMMDITHWLIEAKGVEQVIAVARRGPAEVKFDRKEFESVIGYLDMSALDQELERVRPTMQAIGQDANEFRAMIQATAAKGEPAKTNACFNLHFLSSPARIQGNDQGQASGLVLEENTLILGENGESRARGTGVFHTLDVDTVIFAIGDVVDSAIGLPTQYGEFVKSQQPRFPVDGNSYEAFDPHNGQTIPDVFLAGWARRASTGLVGIARKDATNAAQAVSQYLQTQSPTSAPVTERLRERLASLNHPVVDKPTLQRLEALERERARELSVETFKFSSNREMLEVLGLAAPAKK
jgi:ferredoxin/flavodoxin---NADP+ reductase